MPYVYLWLREDGIPYYVGKGTGRRGFISAQHSVHRPADTRRIILQEYETEKDAFEAERFFIEFYGRIDLGTGCLHNHAEGGLGGSAAANGKYVRTEEHREQLRQRMKSGQAAKAGCLGGKAMAKGLKTRYTPEQRKAWSQKVHDARWRKVPNS